MSNTSNLDNLNNLAASLATQNSGTQNNVGQGSSVSENALDQLANQLKQPDLTQTPKNSSIMSDVGSGISDFLGDVAVGGARFGEGITRAGERLIGAPLTKRQDWNQVYGNAPGVAGNIIENVAQAAPYYLNPETLLGTALGGGAYGLTQSDTPIKSAAENIAMAPIAFGAGKLASMGLDTIPGLFKSIANSIKGKTQQNIVENAAKPVLDSLAQQSGDPENLDNISGNAVRGALKDEMKQAKTNFDPINNSDIRLDELTKDQQNPFPNYSSAANELLAQRENMQNIFGSASPEMRKPLQDEIDKASSVLTNKDDSGFTLPEAVDRVKTLGQLTASAPTRNEARLLGNLRDGLKTDVMNILDKSGNKDIGDQWQKAIDHYRDNVIPFYRNSTIRKIVTDKNEIPVGAKLANALHNPNNSVVMDKLPTNIKNAQLSRLITKGKGTAEGMSSLTPQQIGSAWNSLDNTTKAIVKKYNPDANAFFEGLSGLVSKPKQGVLNTAKSLVANSLSKNLGSIKSLQPPGVSGFAKQGVNVGINQPANLLKETYLSKLLQGTTIPYVNPSRYEGTNK